MQAKSYAPSGTFCQREGSPAALTTEYWGSHGQQSAHSYFHSPRGNPSGISSYPSPSFAQPPSHSQTAHSNSVGNNYLDLTAPPNSFCGTGSGSSSAPISSNFYPADGMNPYPIPPQDMMGSNYPCTFHQYTWLKSANPELWWNAAGTGKIRLNPFFHMQCLKTEKC